LAWLQAEAHKRQEMPQAIVDALSTAALTLLEAAEDAASGRRSFRGMLSGANVQTAAQYLSAARTNLFRLAPSSYLRSQLPNLIMEAQGHIGDNDLRMATLERLQKEPDTQDLQSYERSALISSVQGVQREIHREQSRIRSFRNVIVGVSLAVAIIVLGLMLIGFYKPGTLPLCFVPDDAMVVCPTDEMELSAASEGEVSPATSVTVTEAVRDAAGSWDAAVVGFVGLMGATLAAAAGLRNIRGSSDPFSLPVALALLKLPTGAFTALLGMLLIRAGFVPGLSALDTSAQIIAYAVLLGYSQQLFTTFVDRQAETVLAEAGTTLPATPRPAERMTAVPTTLPSATTT
jgi:hypothetical protein